MTREDYIAVPSIHPSSTLSLKTRHHYSSQHCSLVWRKEFLPLFNMAITTLKFLFSYSLILLSLVSNLQKGYSSHRVDATTHHFVQLSSLLPSSTCRSSTKGSLHHGDEEKGASLRLAHKLGPCSPSATPSQSKPLNLTEVFVHDQARVKSIHSKLSTPSQSFIQGKKATAIPAKDGSVVGSGNYVVTIGIGTPKKDVTLIFDTGSDVTWTQCQPCAKYCHPQKDPIFDPAGSTSYANISCTADICNRLGATPGIQTGCSTSTCVYGIQYGDQSYSIGFVVKEKITLTPTDFFNTFYLGCGQNNRGLFGQSDGLLGLGRDPFSFVSQTASKYGKYFSYCLPSTPSSTGYLTFGRARQPKKVQFTSLGTKSQGPSFYFIEIVGISVGGKKLSIPVSLFSSAGTLIDSGTVISRLPPTAYTAMSTAFKQLMTNYPIAPAFSILDTCYDLSNFTNKSITVPKIAFYFSGGAVLDVDISGILYVVSASQVCLAMAGNSADSSVAIFGNVQQQTYNVIYDVAGGKLGFSPGGCA